MNSTTIFNQNSIELIYTILWIGLIYLLLYFFLLLLSGAAAKISGNYLSKTIYKELKEFPLSIWLTTILLTVTQIPQLESDNPLLMTFISVVSAIILFFLVSRIINSILVKYFRHKARKSKDKQKAHYYKYISHIAQALIWFTAFVIILTIAGVDLNGLFAFLGFSSLGLSFALRNTIKDVLNSFIIVFQKPFEAGDYIKNVDSYGQVDEVGLKNTRLKGIDNKEIYIPNSWLMDKPLTNYRDRDNIQVKYHLSINTPKLGKYDRKIDIAKRKIYQATDMIEKNSLELIATGVSSKKQDFDITLILDLDDRANLDNVNHDLMHSIFKIFRDLNFDVEEITLDDKPSPFSR